MKVSKSVKGILGIALISLIVMSLYDSFINTGYIQKSGLKILMFLVLPGAYTLYDHTIKFKDNFQIKSKKKLVYSVFLGIGVYLVILAAYFLLKDYIDLSNIMGILEEDVRVGRENFLWIALYISFVNSLLEEFFFRGFIFLNLKRISGRKMAYLISALGFSIYHVAIMGSWFNPVLFIVAMAGLFIGGLIFNYLNDEGGNIYSSWIVHMMANLSINTVGLMMFEII